MCCSLTTSAPHVSVLIDRIISRGSSPVLCRNGSETSARELIDRAEDWCRILGDAGIRPSSVCAYDGDYSPETVSLMLALMRLGAVQVPFSTGAAVERDELAAIAQVEWRIDPSAGPISKTAATEKARHELLRKLEDSGHPGLVVFTSGSSGKPKAILHDLDRVAGKFSVQRQPWRMLLMLLMDHFGGFNTLLSCLSDGGVGVCVAERSPLNVCEAIARDRVELLPTTPTFLAMLIGSELWKTYELSSLKLITYGAEPMPPATLSRLRQILPDVQLKQTYGMSELGVLRSSSPEPGSLWLRIGGDGFETRVVDGLLHIRSASNMLGYLNAPSPIDDEGWMNTGDLVETRDGLIRFLGRESEVINVGGQKVFPTEVESVIMEVDGVAEAVVTSKPHSLLGNAVVARVALTQAEDPKSATDRLRDHCRKRLQKYKVPMRFELVELSELTTQRAKKRRHAPPDTPDSRTD